MGRPKKKDPHSGGGDSGGGTGGSQRLAAARSKDGKLDTLKRGIAYVLLPVTRGRRESPRAQVETSGEPPGPLALLLRRAPPNPARAAEIAFALRALVNTPPRAVPGVRLAAEALGEVAHPFAITAMRRGTMDLPSLAEENGPGAPLCN